MKNLTTQFALVIIAFVAITFLMSYTRPVADEPKHYIVVMERIGEFEGQVNQKLAEGWHLQGGVSSIGNVTLTQAMVK
jgi:hypothetical protein